MNKYQDIEIGSFHHHHRRRETGDDSESQARVSFQNFISGNEINEFDREEKEREDRVNPEKFLVLLFRVEQKS